MLISDLVEQSGLPLARIKFYLREGLLSPGQATSATRATYDESHLGRLRLIHALTSVVGLPLSRTRKVLEVLDDPRISVVKSLGQAIAALAPDPASGSGDGYPRARAAIEFLGPGYTPTLPALAQLDQALEAVNRGGFPATEERLRVYGLHLWAIAQMELEGMPQGDRTQAIEYAVLGTALYEPVLTAVRRLAHQCLAAGQFPPEPVGPDGPGSGR